MSHKETKKQSILMLTSIMFRTFIHFHFLTLFRTPRKLVFSTHDATDLAVQKGCSPNSNIASPDPCTKLEVFFFGRTFVLFCLCDGPIQPPPNKVATGTEATKTL